MIIYKQLKSLNTIILLCTVVVLQSDAQSAFIPLSNDVESLYAPYLNKPGNSIHTSLKPYLLSDIKEAAPYDSLNKSIVKDSRFTNSWIGRKLFKEHLLFIEKDDYKLYLDPVFEFSAGRDQENKLNYYSNTRGYRACGTIGKRFSFNTTFYENQSKFPYYLDSSVNKTRIVPGQGRVKQNLKKYDYNFATGSITFQLDKHFTFSFGNDKNFIGDGYRSLLLSDNAFDYPSFKIITDVWKIRYTNMFAVMRDLSRDDPNDDFPFTTKYGSFHYLDLNVGKHASIGLFEAVIWHADSTGARGFDLGYLNPIIFLRPVEFSIGSPDNALLGINGKVMLNSRFLLYGQVMLDEFVLREVKSGDGWWGNKQGVQAGFKAFNFLGIKNLYIQGEGNFVRPFTYSHRTPEGNYGHYRAALAHPLGANFIEVVGITRYTYRNIELYARLSYAEVGYDSAKKNFGQNIFLSYDTRYQDYDNRTGQGDKHKIMWAVFNASYLINPVTRFCAFIEISMRNEMSLTQKEQNTILMQGGIKTRLFNRYYDF